MKNKTKAIYTIVFLTSTMLMHTLVNSFVSVVFFIYALCFWENNKTACAISCINALWYISLILKILKERFIGINWRQTHSISIYANSITSIYLFVKMLIIIDKSVELIVFLVLLLIVTLSFFLNKYTQENYLTILYIATSSYIIYTCYVKNIYNGFVGGVLLAVFEFLLCSEMNIFRITYLNPLLYMCALYLLFEAIDPNTLFSCSIINRIRTPILEIITINDWWII